MQPSAITKPQWQKIGKVVVYAATSAVIAKLTALIANDPSLFGTLTPVINVALVTIKQFFTEGK